MECKRCDSQALSGKKLCDKCSQKQKIAALKTRERKRLNGICTDCSNKVHENHNHCLECLEKAKQRRENRKRKKLCTTCGSAANNGTVYCDGCRENNRTRRAADRQQRSILGICRNCSNKAIENKTLCNNCLDERRIQKEQLLATGLCTACGKRKVYKNLKRCKQCTNYDIQRRKQFEEDGVCICCGKPKDHHKNYCEECYFKRTSKAHFGSQVNWEKLKTLIEAQEFRCPYSGATLIIGGNTELDHIIPKSRGGSLDVSNVQWTTRIINRMKNNSTHSEFLEEIKKVYINCF